MSMKKLLTASKDYVNKTEKHCLVLTMSDCGTEVEVSGDCVWVKSIREKPALEFFSKSLIEATDVQDHDVVLQHAKPGTKKWKGLQIMAQLTRYLSFIGFGQNKKRYGTGIPTLGCSVLLDWRSFKGPSLSCFCHCAWN